MSSWIPFHRASANLVDATEGSYVLAAICKGEVGANVRATEDGSDIPVPIDDAMSNFCTGLAIGCWSYMFPLSVSCRFAAPLVTSSIFS